ncbi:hypothetical protein BN3087_480001 [Sulfurovum sp. enrichment culture clone C5]|uniref:Uncharacterized protein n=1 Tax=Sulfurovum sp. enrichment culture clone C5 TaxID=497650 RepID=A0A0S4XP35_9BACT|nr:hypothetical protein BN3087_480001 [Sulfurovum sp. enrichment culture clone C5]
MAVCIGNEKSIDSCLRRSDGTVTARLQGSRGSPLWIASFFAMTFISLSNDLVVRFCHFLV